MNALVLIFLCVYGVHCALRIKSNHQATNIFINVFDADDNEQYFLYPTYTKQNRYTLNNSIKKLSNKFATFHQSTVSIKTTGITNDDIFLFPYEVCLGTVIGKNKGSASFIIQTAAHCIVHHPQFQSSLSSSIRPKVSSILIYVYSKILNDPLLYLGGLWIIILIISALSFWYLSCKTVLLLFSVLVIVINICVHFGQQEMLKNDASQMLHVSMDIKHATYTEIQASYTLSQENTTMSKSCNVLYFSLENMLNYRMSMMDVQQWSKLLVEQGDFAFLECTYDPSMYRILSTYLVPSYPNIVERDLLNALLNVKQTGIMNFDNINKYVMISGTFQRFVFNSPNGFVGLHRKQICKRYMDGCRMHDVIGDNTNDKMLEELTPWIQQYESEQDVDYKYEQYISSGAVHFAHSEHYFIGTFGAIQGFSGSAGVAGDNLNEIGRNAMNNIFHCILVRGTLDLEMYRGNWCMLATHKVYASTYYRLIHSKSNYFDISKIDKTFMRYSKKMMKSDHHLEKFELRTKSEISATSDLKIEI